MSEYQVLIEALAMPGLLPAAVVILGIISVATITLLIVVVRKVKN